MSVIKVFLCAGFLSTAAPSHAAEAGGPDQRQCFCLQATTGTTAGFLQYHVIQLKGILPACDKMEFKPGPRFVPGSLMPCDKLKKCHSYAGLYADRNREARKKIAGLEASAGRCVRAGGAASDRDEGCFLPDQGVLERYRLEKAGSEKAVRLLWEICFDTTSRLENYSFGETPGPAELSMASPKSGVSGPAAPPVTLDPGSSLVPGAPGAAVGAIRASDGDYPPDTPEWAAALASVKAWCGGGKSRCFKGLTGALETPWRGGDCSGRLHLPAGGKEGWMSPSICGGVPYAVLKRTAEGWTVVDSGYEKSGMLNR